MAGGFHVLFNSEYNTRKIKHQGERKVAPRTRENWTGLTGWTGCQNETDLAEEIHPVNSVILSPSRKRGFWTGLTGWTGYQNEKPG
jgi:hypothetical protein